MPHMLARAAFRRLPMRLMTMLDGRPLGVLAVELTCGTHAVAVVPTGLIVALGIARDALRNDVGSPSHPLVLIARADGHLQLHAVETNAVLIAGGISYTGETSPDAVCLSVWTSALTDVSVAVPAASRAVVVAGLAA